jgi:hypothetical protein
MPATTWSSSLRKPDTNHLGCFIEWDEDGFSEYGIELETLFTRDWMVPSPDNDPSKKVAASLSANGTDWDDLILGGTLEKAEIVGAGGITILGDSLYYDFSDFLLIRRPSPSPKTIREIPPKPLEVSTCKPWKWKCRKPGRRRPTTSQK